MRPSRENLLFGFFQRLLLYLLAIFIPAIACRYFGDNIGFIVALLVVVVFIGFINSSDEKKEPSLKVSSLLSKNYPPDWEEISRQVRDRDGYRCGNCGSKTNLHVHHIVPLARGGTNQLSNLRTLCEDCHKKIHPHMN